MTTLLQPGDPAPVVSLRPSGASRFLLVCDHAGQAVPRALAGMGIPKAELDRHIGWDIGAAGVTRILSEALDAPAILQAYSRLVIDCNRRPGHPTSIAPVSDGTIIAANSPASDGDPPWRAAREAEIFAPYHDAIAARIEAMLETGRQPAMVSVHSFTPVMAGVARAWQAGVLFNRNPEWSLAVAGALRENGLIVGENEPYALSDESDYTVPAQAQLRGLPYLELEIRQDLIANDQGQTRWAHLLATVLRQSI